jgi:hypothetical protein
MSNIKLITVPSRGTDLFTLRKTFGIKQGPLKTPLAVPVELIGELLNQYNYPEVFEVVVESIKKYPTEEKIYSTPVRLTRENYTQPYHEIAGTSEVIAIEVFDNTPVEVETTDEETFQESIEPDKSDEGSSEQEVEKTEEVIETIETDEVVEGITEVEKIEEVTETIETDEVVEGTTEVEKIEEDDENGDDPLLALAEQKTAVNVSSKNNKKHK